MKTTHDPLVVSVGAKIRSLRTARGLTLGALANLAEVHHAHLKAIENGTCAANSRTLRVIALALGVTSVDLLNVGDDDLGAIVEVMRNRPEEIQKIRAYVNLRVIN